MKITLLVVAVVLCCVPLFAELSVSYGEGEGKVSYYNAKNHPNAEELFAVGPLSFRMVGDETWVADSLMGRILRFSPAGKLAGTINVVYQPTGRIEDFTVKSGPDGKPVSLLVLCSADQIVYEVSTAGKILRKFGGIGEDLGHFLQFDRVEVLPSGEFCVSDKQKQTLTLFSADGKPVREVHWEWSGFCFDPAGHLCRLNWKEDEQENHLIVETFAGKQVRDVPLKIGPHINPDLIFVSADGEAAMTSMPADGYKGKLTFSVCDAKGQPKVTKEFVPPYVMNRYLVQDNKGRLFLGVANFDQAPEGTFKVEAFSWK